MKDRNVISWSVVSLVGFLVVNLLMGQSFVQVPGIEGHDFWSSTLIAIVLYAVGIVLAALNWRPAFYVLGFVIAIYSLGIVGMLINLITLSHATLLIRAMMVVLGIAILLANAYWLVLALRFRKAERDARDRRRFGN